MNKSLLTITALTSLLFCLGCESTDSSTASTETAAPTGTTTATTAQQAMTPSEITVMKMQALDRQYANGALTPGDYDMQRQAILDMY
ncbi:hypothetical protein [Cerasicoccus maritimus]|uniref:hypothetical protein n=1 Tax=Cerasicoccus maritimus TaxID=490089 RepID=UPI00285282A6|nr:hypothetical protein [Cerasicoccus maritimus]